MNTERLLNVARALRESPAPEKFTMGSYLHTCGTPACALGHYAARRDLQSIFKPFKGKWAGFVSLVEPRYEIDPDGDNYFSAHDVDYDEKEVLEHFEIDDEQARELFSGEGCGGARTAFEAAEYIENFVAREGV